MPTIHLCRSLFSITMVSRVGLYFRARYACTRSIKDRIHCPAAISASSNFVLIVSKTFGLPLRTTSFRTGSKSVKRLSDQALKAYKRFSSKAQRLVLLDTAFQVALQRFGSRLGPRNTKASEGIMTTAENSTGHVVSRCTTCLDCILELVICNSLDRAAGNATHATEFIRSCSNQSTTIHSFKGSGSQLNLNLQYGSRTLSSWHLSVTSGSNACREKV